MSTFEELLLRWQRADAEATAYWLSHPACSCQHERFTYRQLREAADGWYAMARLEMARERLLLPLL